MLPVELLSALKAYALSKETLPVAATDPAAKPGATGAASFEQGQKLQGAVLAEISPGLFKVRVANQLVQMKLPALVHTGDTVELQVVSLQPRLTFSMVASANPLSTSQQLSTTARMLSALSQQQPEKALVGASSKPPLVTTAEPPQAQSLANVLREAINNSGLFYESHQAQWLEGARTTTQLLQEPQNQSAPVMTQQTAMVGSNANPNANPNSRVANMTPAIAEGTASPPAPSGQSQSSQPVSIPIPPHLQSLVQQQLSALETGRILWQGQVFQNQPLQWQIWQQSGQGQAPGSEQERIWATSLQLELPTLGSVTAQMRLSPNGLSLTLDAGSPHTRTLLGSASSRLVSALNEAGIKVNSALMVQHETS
jgi:hypothetical protein